MAPSTSGGEKAKKTAVHNESLPIYKGVAVVIRSGVDHRVPVTLPPDYIYSQDYTVSVQQSAASEVQDKPPQETYDNMITAKQLLKESAQLSPQLRDKPVAEAMAMLGRGELRPVS